MGIGNSIPINPNFWPKVRSHLFRGTHISRFIDQAIAQWNSSLVRKLFAPHITNSAVKKPPSRLGIANKLISLRDYMNLSFFFRVKWIYLLLHGDSLSRSLLFYENYQMIIFQWEGSLQRGISSMMLLANFVLQMRRPWTTYLSPMNYIVNSELGCYLVG